MNAVICISGLSKLEAGEYTPDYHLKGTSSMHARTTTVRFQPGTADEATRIIREIMLPGASVQRGFTGALMLKSDTDSEKYTIISIWETLDDLLASTPTEESIPLLEPLDDFITETSQDTYEVLFQIDEHSHKKPKHK